MAVQLVSCPKKETDPLQQVCDHFSKGLWGKNNVAGARGKGVGVVEIEKTEGGKDQDSNQERDQ